MKECRARAMLLGTVNIPKTRVKRDRVAGVGAPCVAAKRLAPAAYAVNGRRSSRWGKILPVAKRFCYYADPPHSIPPLTRQDLT